MIPFQSTTLKAALFFFLMLSSLAILYATFQNTRSARQMADQALEGTGLALASTVEAELRSGDTLSKSHVRRIFFDRVIAYALVADNEGSILFHTNPDFIGKPLEEPGLKDWLQSGQAYGRRITLRTGLSAFEYNYLLHLSDGRAQLLRLVLHTFTADGIVSRAQRMWWTVGLVLLILWTLGILFEKAVSRQIRLQQELQQKNQLALIGQMTAVLAHEIRNALGSIKGYTQWTAGKMEESDPKKSGLAMVIKGTDRIESLVNDLLLFSREETFFLEPLAVHRLIEEVIHSEIPQPERTVELVIEPGLQVLADKEKIHRVLLNGIQNALQAGEDRPTFRILVEARAKGVEIRIEDSGPGIRAEDLPRLFTPFFTTKTAGTGLGLAYSKKVVEGMGGEISLFNSPGKGGAVLLIKLPRAERA